MSEPRTCDDRHALYAGWVAGLAHRQGLDIAPVLDPAGVVTDHLVVGFGDERVTVVIPYPPEDWP